MSSATSAAVLLAVIALSDGLRLLPAGAIVVSRVALTAWAVTWVNAERRTRPRLITWCSPVATPLVLLADVESRLSPGRRLARLRARMRRTRSHVVALRTGGLLILTVLIAGIPWLTARAGIWGFLLGLLTTLWLCVMQSAIAIAALRRAGVGLKPALVSSVKYLWPFSAPRAAEEVTNRATAGTPALVVLHALLPPAPFRRFVRPLLFDAIVRGEQADQVAELRDFLGEPEVAMIVNELPSVRDGDAFCPRCGASFYRVARFCSDCADVQLRPQSAG